MEHYNQISMCNNPIGLHFHSIQYLEFQNLFYPFLIVLTNLVATFLISPAPIVIILILELFF